MMIFIKFVIIFIQMHLKQYWHIAEIMIQQPCNGLIYIEGKKGSFKATENPWAWNFFGHLMCIDQPIGVGFSYNNNTKKVNSTREAANHFVNFLANFFTNNPKLGLQNNPLYIAGQSYAGHYIPAFAEKIKTNTKHRFFYFFNYILCFFKQHTNY